MKARMRSSVSVVMRPPWRSRLASLPSLTARRPNVDSAKPVWRQYSEISCSSSCAFMANVPGFPHPVPGGAACCRLIRRGTDEIGPIPWFRVNHKFAHYWDGQVYGQLPIFEKANNKGET